MQAQILDLINDLQSEFGSAVIIITHDLGVVAELADDILVMYAGRVAEYGAAADIFDRPDHPYTWGLLASMPRLDRERTSRLVPIPGTPPSLIRVPPGCPFHPRCRYTDLTGGRCDTEVPPLREVVTPGHAAACHLTAEERARQWAALSAGKVRDAKEPVSPGRQARHQAPFARQGGSVTEPIQTPPASPAGNAAEHSGDVLLRVTGLVRHFPVTRGVVFRHQVGAVRPWTGSTFGVQGPDPRPGRRIGLRQDHYRAPADPAGRADQRPDRDRGP